MRILFTAFFVFAILITQGYSQAPTNGAAVQVLLKGKVLDELTNTPVGVTMEFIGPKDKRFKINTNSLDGSYQQVLNAGESYDIILSNYDVVRKKVTVNMEKTVKYYEKAENFTVMKFTPNGKVFDVDIFAPQQENVSESAKKFFLELQEIMTFNRFVKFYFNVNSHDSYRKSIIQETVEPKSKKKKKDVKPETITKMVEPDEASIRELVDKRVSALNAFITAYPRFKDRVIVQPDYTAGEQNAGTAANNDLLITVWEIKNKIGNAN